MNYLRVPILCLLFSLCGFKCSGNSKNASGGAPPPSDDVKSLRLQVLDVFPHNSESFTQGLEVDGEFFYETTGQYGSSKLLKNEVKTGKAVKELSLADTYFGEGMTRWQGEIFVLTWKARKGFSFVETEQAFEERGSWSYQGEGWGLTHDGENLIMSDGTATLRYLSPDAKTVIRTLEVTLDESPLRSLNELEFANGKIYSNVWMENFIVAIDPQSGKVVEKIEVSLHELFNSEELTTVGAQGRVLNGIAYDKKSEAFYITGKNWPKIFHVNFVE